MASFDVLHGSKARRDRLRTLNTLSYTETSSMMQKWVCLLVLVSAAAARAEQVVVTVLATTDLHGNIFPIDYTTGNPAERGLAKIATLIREAERENPNHVLIDCGDTIQG